MEECGLLAGWRRWTQYYLLINISLLRHYVRRILVPGAARGRELAVTAK